MSSAEALVSKGQFQEALDLLWTQIDSGSDPARIELANLFTANGLHSFAQDQWVFLAEKESELSVSAKLGIGANLLWLRDYDAACSASEGLPGSELLLEAIVAAKAKDPLVNPQSLSEIASEVLFEEAKLLQQLSQSFSIQAQVQLIQVRDVIANISAIISYPGNEHLRSLQLELDIGSNVSVPRPLSKHFGNPKVALVNTAHACGVLINALGQGGNQVDTDHFRDACKVGLSSFEKIFLFSEEIYSPNDAIEAEAFHNITWGLGALGLFSGYVYGGLWPED